MAGAVSVAAELARCRTSGDRPARSATCTASSKRPACAWLTGWSGPPSANAKWLQTPTTSTPSVRAAAAHSAGQSAATAPPRDSPVSALRWTRATVPVAAAAAAAAASSARSYTPRSTPAATAGARSSSGVNSHASTGASMPAARRARASSRKATPSQAAPPASTAEALGTSPCP